MPRLQAAGSALALMLWPAFALGCPVCAQREDGGPLGKIALGVLIVSPWIVALVVGLWIRRGLLAEKGRLEINE